MNPGTYKTITKLIMAQFASNAIDAIVYSPHIAATESPAAYASEYFDIELSTIDETTGKTVSCAGSYITRIFEDILDKTGVNLLNFMDEKGKYHSMANVRKRLLGVMTSYTTRTAKEYAPIEPYRNMIVDYLGAKTWSQLCKDAEELLAEQEAYLQDVADGTCQPAVMALMLNPAAVKRGSLLCIRFKNASVTELYCIGDCTFHVRQSDDTGLRKGDIISLTDRILIGNRLIAEVTSTYKYRFSDTWLSESSIRSFEVIKDYHTQLIA